MAINVIVKYKLINCKKEKNFIHFHLDGIDGLDLLDFCYSRIGI